MPRLTITVAELTPQPYRFGLDRQIITIGRSKENDIVLDCGSISRHHAAVYRLEGSYELRDEDSTNGIKLDGVRQEVIPLKNGLSILLGNVGLDFELSNTELAALELEKPIKMEAKKSEVKSEVVEKPQETKELQALEKKTPEKKTSTSTDSEEMAPALVMSRSGSGIGFFTIALVFVAFVLGMAIRYKKDTGNSLIESVMAKFSGQSSVGHPSSKGSKPNNQ
jgi:pSer/pThr/pTyr-binding forkhead associated (FHA) protein